MATLKGLGPVDPNGSLEMKAFLWLASLQCQEAVLEYLRIFQLNKEFPWKKPKNVAPMQKDGGGGQITK